MADVELKVAVTPYVNRIIKAIRSQDCADPLFQILDDYARANLAPLQAENDRLRAEFRDLRLHQASWEHHVAAVGCEYVRDGDVEALVNLRAERLAEALRHVERRLDWLCSERESPARGKTAALIRELWSQVCRALAQEGRNGSPAKP